MRPRSILRRQVLVTLGVLSSIAAAPLLAQRDTAVPRRADVATITHVLNRIGFGPRPGDVERVQKMGLAAYIEQQLHPERVSDDALEARLAEFETIGLSQEQLAAKFFVPAEQLQREQQQRQRQAAAQAADPMMTGATPPPTPEQLRAQLTPEQRMIQQGAQRVPQELMSAKVLRAVMSEHQLEEVLVDFWFNHFNVFLGKGQVRQYITTYEHEAIRPHVFGTFRDMLGATAHHPAMLFYLDNFQSQAPPDAPTLGMAADRLRPGQRGRPPLGRIGRPGQQVPQVRIPPAPNRQQRGLNENYARELMELHTLGVDGGYTQQDVIALARILTGWTIDQPRLGGKFIFRPQAHDAGDKKLLGVHFPAGRGEDEGERALDLLASHPATAKHIAFKLAQRFVADEPPAALVERAAKRFLDTKGDLREVTRTIITSPEFFAQDAQRAKVKTPFEFVVSAARATNANVVNPQPIVQALRQALAMPLYGCQPPTGYSMTADAWVNTGALLSRMNFAVQLLAGGQPVGPNRGGDAAPGRPAARGGLQLRPNQQARMPIQVNVAALAPDTSEASRERVVTLLLAGQASAGTLETLSRAATPQQLIALTLGSPEFQRR